MVHRWLGKCDLVMLMLLGIFMMYPLTNGQAEGPKDPAPEIVPKNANGLKVLFDNTHAQTAGAADWVIDGAFSDFANGIANNGYYVKELRKEAPITLDDLSQYDVFVIPEANTPFKTSEQEAMIQYVKEGGSIFFISDHYNADRNKNRWDSSEVMNGYRRGAYENPAKGMTVEEASSKVMKGVESSDWLSDHFGIRFRYNAPGNINANKVVSSSESFGITEGVQTVAMHAGSTLAITDPSKAKGIVYLPEGLDAGDKWNNSVDQGIYFGGGEEEGPYAAISKLGLGKAAFIGDSSPVEDITPKYKREETGGTKRTYDGFKEADDATLLLNTIDWLAKEESYTSFEEKGIPLDEPSPMLETEVPANSKEPQAEPWSQPAKGYKWYDASTFASGSYGSSENPPVQSSYELIHQDILPNNDEFQLRISAKGVEPNAEISGLQIGMYVEGGMQVAQVKSENGTWPSSYGYSTPFSLKAGSNGEATIDLKMRVKEGIKGDVNLRLRKDGENVLTKSVKVDDVATSPLPEENTKITTIKQARQSELGQMVTVEGIVTSQPGIFGGQGFYIQDDTGGIYVFQHEADYNVGDQLRITAQTEVYNGEFELVNPASIEKIGKTQVPESKVVTSLNQENQGEKVQLKEGKISNVTSSQGAFEFDLIHENNITKVRVDHRTEITQDEFHLLYKEGDIVTINGISSNFKGTYQLKLLSLDDLEKVISQDITPPTIEDMSDMSVFVTGEFLQEIQVRDDQSGVNDIIVTLNGKESNNLHLAPMELPPGKYPVTIRVTDKAGNETSKTYDLLVKLDVDHLDELLEAGNERGYLKNKGAFVSLSKQISNIQKAKSSYLQEQKLEKLLRHIEKQNGKKVAEEFVSYWKIIE
ncbi:endonuclease [Priestia endophytica]|uniref:Endonuclease n=1 Tax=Priestia endophytica TaxID=135735 RepID=A0AAX1Q3M3_9BACI|nr:endonuclease [Priestia endophytica]RAS72329.1 endonuclease [Priestia endophytica]RAS89967.1 endonuclease [Priestia endophytica]